MPKLTKNKVAKKDQLDKELNAKISSLKKACTLDTKCLLVNAVDEADESIALELAKELESEFKVKTSSEKILVHMAVQSFIRMNKCSRLLTVNTPSPHIWHEIAHHISVYSKEIDKAFRQNISALQTLRAIKQPPLKVNIKTNNAFVAENMQNNATVSNNLENNEPQ